MASVFVTTKNRVSKIEDRKTQDHFLHLQNDMKISTLTYDFEHLAVRNED